MDWDLAGSLLKIGVGVAIAVPATIYLLQDSLIFHPQPMAESRRASVAQSAQSLFIEARDGTRLHAWHRPGVPLTIYFGGNAEEVSWMIARAAREAPGSGWLFVDYRGYGSSGGSPSEAALVSDALEWHTYATQKLGASRVFLFGRSLGSGVAVQLAAARPVAGLMLVAPYDSLVSLAQHYYPFLPVRWMLKHPFESLEHSARVSAPLLCLVAERDEVIPVVHSRRLYDAWKGPKRWVELKGAGHNSTDDAAAFWQAIREFLGQPH